MEKPFQKINLEELILISKSKNKVGGPLYREDLPSVLYSKAPRILKGKKWFNKYSESNQSPVCQICQKLGPTDRHEVYGLYKWKEFYVIKLEGILRVCSNCHQKIHGGFSSHRDMHYGFVRDPVPVSGAMSSKKYPWNKAMYILIEDKLYFL